jgi:octaprenyl-diphosphate synthase
METQDHLAELSHRQPGAAHVTSTLRQISTLLADELIELEASLSLDEVGASRCATAATELLGAGGKRLRPILALLAFRIASGIKRCPPATLRLAGAVELLHAATLLHDDVVDEGRLRRGRPCARVTWGNACSVIAGDLLLVQAMERLHTIGDARIDRLFDRSLGALIEGEVLQLERRGDLHVEEIELEHIARLKTCSLFVLAAVGGALLGGADGAQAGCIEQVAVCTGLAFQLVDDLLDLCSSPEVLGKAVGQDLATGCITLPLSDVLAAAPHVRVALEQHVAEGQDPLPQRVAQDILVAAAWPGVLQRSRARVRSHGQRALEALRRLRACEEREALAGIVKMLCLRAQGATTETGENIP